NDLLSVAVDHWEYRPCDSARDATDVVAEILGRIGSRIVVARAFTDRSQSCFGKDIGCSTVGRIGNERCLLARTPCALAPMSRRACTGARIVGDKFLLVGFRLARKYRFPIREFFFRVVEAIAELRGPIHWGSDAVIARPYALQIRITPRRFW